VASCDAAGAGNCNTARIENCDVTRTKKFIKTLNKIRDASTQEKILKQIKKILENPDVGKPLRHSLKGERTVYIWPHRLIYSVDKNKTTSKSVITLLRFEHRDRAYK